jgi:hypothetical protein
MRGAALGRALASSRRLAIGIDGGASHFKERAIRPGRFIS